MSMAPAADATVPVEISRAGARDVSIRWADGHVSIYPAPSLRLACPCAGCVDEVTGKRRVQARAIPDDIRPVTVTPVGRYGVSIQWSDGHATGIYAFGRLRAACPCAACQAGA